MKHIQELRIGDPILCVNNDMSVTFDTIIDISYCEDSEQFVLRLESGILISNTMDMEYAECEMNNSVYVF